MLLLSLLIMQVEVNMKYMQTILVDIASPVLEILLFFFALKNGQISLLTHGLYIVHGHQKI